MCVCVCTADKQGRFYLLLVGHAGTEEGVLPRSVPFRLMIVLIGAVFKWLFVDGGVWQIFAWTNFRGGMTKRTVPPLVFGEATIRH